MLKGEHEHKGTVLLCRKKITIAQQNRSLVLCFEHTGGRFWSDPQKVDKTGTDSI